MRTNPTAPSPSLVHNPQPRQQRLLYTRAQAAQLLACSIATLIRAEARGDLHAVRLNPKSNAKVFYRAADVYALAESGAETRATHGGELGLEGAPEGTSITPSFAPSNEVEQTSRPFPRAAMRRRDIFRFGSAGFRGLGPPPALSCPGMPVGFPVSDSGRAQGDAGVGRRGAVLPPDAGDVSRFGQSAPLRPRA